MFLDNIVEYYLGKKSNMFTLTGNIDDLLLIKNEEKSVFQLLVRKFEDKNHVLIYSPSKGMRFSKKESKEEFFAYDSELSEIHKEVFDLDYGDSKYNIISGLHHIKSLLKTYEKLQVNKKKIKNLVIILEDADIVFPSKPISQMGIDEKIAISLAREMFSNSSFIDGHNMVVMLAATNYSIDNSVRMIPTLTNVVVDLPDMKKRLEYIEYINSNFKKRFNDDFRNEIASISAGISLINLKSILKDDKKHIKGEITSRVATIIASSLDGKVQVFMPKHDFSAVIGYEKLKETLLKLKKRMFLKKSLVWRGLILIGPSGVGKDFVSDAFLSEVGLPTIRLGNLKSKWYGETMQNIEKLKMIAKTFDKLVIFRNEADTMFTNMQGDSHQTDTELMGAYLDWMGDNSDRGKIFWVFNTSRPRNIPTDFERRLELKLPIFDLEGDEKWVYTKKMFQLQGIDLDDSDKGKILNSLKDLSNDNIRAVASEVAVEKELNKTGVDVLAIIDNINFAVVKEEREQQSKDAAMKATYNDLVPDKYKK